MAGGGVEDVYGEDRATEEQLITPWAFSVARSHRFGSIPMLTISSSSTSLSLSALALARRLPTLTKHSSPRYAKAAFSFAVFVQTSSIRRHSPQFCTFFSSIIIILMVYSSIVQ